MRSRCISHSRINSLPTLRAGIRSVLMVFEPKEFDRATESARTKPHYLSPEEAIALLSK
jgi:hypothetical protein